MAKHLSEPSTRTTFFPFDLMDTNEMSTDVEGGKIATKSQSTSSSVKRVKKSKLRQTTNSILKMKNTRVSTLNRVTIGDYKEQYFT